jgi:hypothetical protein
MVKKIRVENNSVVECMNPDEVPEGALDTGDWRDAVSVEPELIAGKQVTDSHWFDLSKTPVEIRWNVKDLSVEDRKQPLFAAVDKKYKEQLTQIVNSANDPAESTQAFLEAMMNKQADKAVVTALTTHQEVDDYIANTP